MTDLLVVFANLYTSKITLLILNLTNVSALSEKQEPMRAGKK